MSSDREPVNIAEKKLIVEVLEHYKGFPCLWDSSHELYCNKDARSQALEIILQKWKTGYPQATIEEVKKKIEHLRAAYRRERKKVESSKSTGAGSGDVHTPSLWYYPYLTFLHEKTMPVSQGIDNMQGSPDSDSEEPVTKKVKSSTKRQNILYKKQEELIQSAAELIKESNSQDTSADAFGRSVSSQLKELPKMQRCIAEKMIGELLFHAKLEELTLDSSINLKRNIHTATQSSYYTHPYRSHLYPQRAFPSSPSPQYLQQPSPSPQYSQTSQSPKYSHTSSSSEHSQSSPSPQHSINSNKNLHTGTQSSYHTHPYRNHLYQQHSLPSSPSPQYIQQPSPSPQYIQQPSPSPQYIQQPSPSPQYIQQPSPSPQYIQQPSPSPQYIQQPSLSPQNSQTSQLPKYSQPSPSPQLSQPLSSPRHYLQESSSSTRQQSTPSLPQTLADSITLYSADTHLNQVLLPADNDTLLELNPSGETQFNEPDTSGSGTNTEVFRGTGKQLQDFLIFKK